jgi:hypothetical protein
MKTRMKLFIFSIFLLVSFNVYGQVLESCVVYQQKGIFSFPKKVLKIKYNLNGKIVSESYTGYLDTDESGPVDITTTYVYKDTILISESSRYFDDKDYDGYEGDSIKTIYTYNINGKLEKSESYSCENGGSWEQTSEINFSYDSSGNKILYDATNIHYSTDNKYTWKYDEKNRVIECHSYEVYKNEGSYKERLYSTSVMSN